MKEISLMVFCAACQKVEESKTNNSATTFVWAEAQEMFKIKRLRVNVKNIRKK